MKIKFFSIRPYEETYLNESNRTGQEIVFEPMPLSIHNAGDTQGFQAISVFTNDDLSAKVLEKLKENGVRYISIRATGYDHIDLHIASQLGLTVANVPSYSPYSVAEHALTLMLTLNRKIRLADQQVKQYDFTLNKLIGFDMHGKTVGIIGLGKIGETLAKILHGFGCTILAYDIVENTSLIEKYGITYCSKETLFKKSDIITLHCPLNEATHYMINKESLGLMKDGVMIVNCGRGGLIHTADVLDALKTGKIGYLGLDVYEKEKGLFFFNHSGKPLEDPMLLALMQYENVVITPHQGFLTTTALGNIADSTFYAIECWSQGKKSGNDLN